MVTEVKGMPVLGNPFAPDVFADEAMSFELTHGTVRITFTAVKMIDGAAPADVQHVVIGRLILPVRSAQSLSIALFDYLKKNGVNPSAALAGEDAAKPN